MNTHATGKESSGDDIRDTDSIPEVRKMPWRESGNPASSVPWRSSVNRGALASYSPCSCKESGQRLKHLGTHAYIPLKKSLSAVGISEIGTESSREEGWRNYRVVSISVNPVFISEGYKTTMVLVAIYLYELFSVPE